MIPSAEQVLRAHLAADATVTAIAVANRIGPRTPRSIEEPWVRITLLDDPPTDGGVVDHLIEAFLQIDCFAGKNGDQTDADDLSRAVRESIRTMKDAAHNDAVVTGSRCSRSRQPDTDHEPAMERYIVTATIWMHA